LTIDDFNRQSSIVNRQLFLPRHAAGTLASSGIGVGPLPSNGQSTPMPEPPIAADLHEPLDVHGHRFSQVALDHSVPLNDVTDAHRLFLGEIFHLGMNINAGLIANLLSPASANPENIRQADLNSFVQRQIHACYSSQRLPPLASILTLALLMFWISALDVDHSLTANDFALIANLLH
jgi:hypothetical protein